MVSAPSSDDDTHTRILCSNLISDVSRREPDDLRSGETRAQDPGTRQRRLLGLAYREDADDSARKLSVCSSIGKAILGFLEGAVFDWRIRDRACRL